MNILYILTIFLITISLTVSADEGDWVDPYQLQMQFIVDPFYAGYLNITRDQAFYYTYFPSQNNPDNDPLILRISAGPGYSPLYSAYYSKGPFIFVKNTKQFRVNPYNWNKQANLLFIQGPSGIGFSQGKDIKYEDNRAAMQYYFSMLKFYQKFPQLKDQTLYITGEQYAGIIAPRMAQIITRINKDADTPNWQKIKLGGLLLNNPCIGNDECDSHNEYTSHTIKYLKNHYFISNQQYEQYRTNCTLPTEDCQNVKKSIQSHFMNTGADLNNIYDQCISQQGDIKCFDQIGILDFLNNKKNKQILNADLNIQWKFFNVDMQKQWIRDQYGAIKIYQKLLKQQNNLKIWILSGTHSGNVPVTGTKYWIEELKHNNQLQMVRMWQPWFYNHTINAGDVQQLRGITLVTVRSAGYKMWNDQPEIAYHVLDSYLKGNSL